MKQNLIPNEPELIDVLNILQKQIMLNLVSHHVGTIEKFDAANQTARVKISYKKTFYEPNQATGDYEEVYKDYPLLIDCPVIVLGGGKGSLRFPIAPGDDCLLLFNDRDIDNWFEGNYDAPPSSLRLHSISDGFALVGIRNSTASLPLYSIDRTEIHHGDKTKLSLGDTDIIFTFIKDSNTTITMKFDGAAGGISFGDKSAFIANETSVEAKFNTVSGFKANNTQAMLNFGSTGFVGAKDHKIVLKSDQHNLKDLLQNLITEITNLNGHINTLVAATAAITVIYFDDGSPLFSTPPTNVTAINAVTPLVNAVTTALNSIKTNIGVLIE